MPQILLVDIGNTLIKWAVCGVRIRAQSATESVSATESATQAKTETPRQTQAADFLAHGAVTHNEIMQLSLDWGRKITQVPRKIVLSSVADTQLTATVLAQAAAVWRADIAHEIFSSASQPNLMPNVYASMGADRLASLIGARAILRRAPSSHLQTALVCNFGTATTLDSFSLASNSAQGEFLGGLILPGLGTMLHSLAHNTARLPQLALPKSASALNCHARNTADAILQGCLHAQVGAVQQALHSLPANTRIFFSGGYAAHILPLLPSSVQAATELVNNLVLRGLAQYAGNTVSR
jgi:type III pantothenate kinase